MFKKLNKKGFTLAELLVVVAIIGVLAAISIPIFTTQLEKAREAVDISNMRAAYAVAQSDVLTEGYKDTNKYTEAGGTYTGYYNVSGDVQATKPTAYGKSTLDNIQTANDLPDNATFTWDGKETGKAVKIQINPTATTGKYVTISWD